MHELMDVCPILFLVPDSAGHLLQAVFTSCPPTMVPYVSAGQGWQGKMLDSDL